MGPWAILVREREWFKLEKLGIIFKEARLETAFEGRRYGLPGASDFELFRICSTYECKYSAAKSPNADYLITDKKVRITLRVLNFVFTDKTDAVLPVVDIHGPREVAQVLLTPNQLAMGIAVVVFGATLRTKQGLQIVEISQSSRNTIAFIINVAIANVVAVVSAV